MYKAAYEYARENKLTIEQIKGFYQLEKVLASKLRNSTKQERKNLYTHLYDELFKKIPYHPLLTRKATPEENSLIVERSLLFLKNFLNPNSVYLEVGSGDCSLALEICKYVKKVYAVDVSNEITKGSNFPENFELIISDGTSIPVSENTVSTIYSNQLMEHLHPEDAIEQLQNIYKALKPGGVYICNTPNRLSGPHDVSQCFDEIATGFHLKEYLISEMYELFKEAGFSQISLYKIYKEIYVKIPLSRFTVFFIKILENILIQLPYSLRRTLAKILIIFRGMTVVGTK